MHVGRAIEPFSPRFAKACANEAVDVQNADTKFVQTEDKLGAAIVAQFELPETPSTQPATQSPMAQQTIVPPSRQQVTVNH